MAHAGGRPPIHRVADIITALNAYIDVTDDPLIEEFAGGYKISVSRFYELYHDNRELAEAISRAIDKQRLFLLRQGTQIRTLEPQIVKLRLIQPCHGMSDRQNVELTGKDGGPVAITLSRLTEDELATMEALLAKARTDQPDPSL
jgi:hypothetical protein